MSEPRRPNLLSEGELFAERYQVEELLGKGGMGAVYRVRDFALGEAVALKLLTLGDEASHVAVMRFRQEVRLARRVTHPNVARVHDLGEHDGRLFLTMELVRGTTLRVVLREEQRLPIGRAIRIGVAILAGLEAAHAASVVHRDLKPENVMIEQGGRVVITDFGIARGLADDMNLTVGMIGTPKYMAPEQLAVGPVDMRADLYALGLLMHEMILGKLPARPVRVDSEAMLRSAPARVVSFVEALLAENADQRPPTALDARTSLEAIAAELGLELETGGSSAPRVSERNVSERSLRFASPTQIGSRSLAVLPFRYRGPEAQAYFGDGLTDELVDQLSRTRGLRVLGSGATAKHKDDRDPRRIGDELGAYAVVDGSVQASGDRVRVTIRLIDAVAGVQLFTERYDGNLADALALQESIARRVAEELRVEITTFTNRGDASPEAVNEYLVARKCLRVPDRASILRAVAGFDRAIALASGFAPALAGRAVACLRAWFIVGPGGDMDWEKEADASVERAIELAPELAETHYAAALRASHNGDLAAVLRSVSHALSIAPTYADAHETLGVLQCEAGWVDEGIARLRLAHELDPTLPYALLTLARYHALRSDHAAAEQLLVVLDECMGRTSMAVLQTRVRLAVWRKDEEEVRRLRSQIQPTSPQQYFLLALSSLFLGEMEIAEMDRLAQGALDSSRSLRFVTLICQLLTEAHAAKGSTSTASLYLVRAASASLIDLDWLDRCPLLDELRAAPDFVAIRAKVAGRASAIWSHSPRT